MNLHPSFVNSCNRNPRPPPATSSRCVICLSGCLFSGEVEGAAPGVQARTRHQEVQTDSVRPPHGLGEPLLLTLLVPQPPARL